MEEAFWVCIVCGDPFEQLIDMHLGARKWGTGLRFTRSDSLPGLRQLVGVLAGFHQLPVQELLEQDRALANVLSDALKRHKGSSVAGTREGFEPGLDHASLEPSEAHILGKGDAHKSRLLSLISQG